MFSLQISHLKVVIYTNWTSVWFLEKDNFGISISLSNDISLACNSLKVSTVVDLLILPLISLGKCFHHTKTKNSYTEKQNNLGFSFH